MIYITGDTHGEHARFTNLYKDCKWTCQDTLIVCGDFGYIFKDNDIENQFLDWLEKQSYTICFVDGNHENFPAIFRYPQQIWNGGKVHRIRKNIIHLMRGQVFTIEGKKIFTMGGAYSMDRDLRIENFSYWNEEMPDKEQYNEAIQNLKNHDNSVDYILTHTCPQEIIRLMRHIPELKEREFTGFLEFLMYELNYTHWYFGHWHLDKQITSKFTALWFETIVIK